jgi:5-methylthioadenosine/S-adenosylhomocysteine deaminase
MAEPSEYYRIIGAKVICDADCEPQALTVHVRDSKITAIEPAATRTQFESNEVELDATGMLMVPGLINAHYHSHDVMSRGLFEDIPLEAWICLAIMPGRAVAPREIRLRTLLGALECLQNGVTTVQDMLGCGPGSEPMVETVISAYAEAGIRCVLGLQVGNRVSMDCLPGVRQKLPLELHGLLGGSSAAVADIVSFIGNALHRDTGPRLHWAIAPGAPQRCTLELLTRMGALAQKHDLPFVTHVNESKLQVYLARELYAEYGGSVLDFLERAGVLNHKLAMAHGVWFDDREIDRIARSGASVTTNPTSNLKLKNGVAPLRKFKLAGVNLGLGCDNTSAGDAQNMFEAMKLICNLSVAKSAGSSPILARDAFHIATLGGAKAIGMDHLIGSITVGKAADLTLLNLASSAYLPLNNPLHQLVYAETGRGVDTVIVDGRVVVKAGRPCTVNHAAIISEVTELSAAFLADSRHHIEKMAPVVPYLVDTVREFAGRHLEFDRFPSASDA